MECNLRSLKKMLSWIRSGILKTGNRLLMRCLWIIRYPEQTKYSTNWFNEILNQNAAYQNYNLTLASGKGAIHSLVSAGFLNQEGTLINTGYKLYSARANIGGQVNKFINMGLNIDGSYYTQPQANATEGRDEIVGDH